jgi:hypothetical protein
VPFCLVLFRKMFMFASLQPTTQGSSSFELP